MSFKEYGFGEEILSAISELGFEKPTEIQEKTFYFFDNNPSKDLIGLAQTGTGKTAAFSLPLLKNIGKKSNKILILCPTRELCIQISKDIKSYGKNIKHLKVVEVYGGVSADGQIRKLKDKPQIIVGTPGRTYDLIRQKKLVLSKVEVLILDEADEMLSMGFKEDLTNILSYTPKEKQVLLFSATMPKEIENIANDYMVSPSKISVGKRNESNKDVSHEYYITQIKNKYLTLKRVVDLNPNIYAIVFCRTRNDTKDIADRLASDGYNSDALHGDLSQAQRDSVMNKFKTKQIQLLIATDVAARGLDVNNLSHVINYGLPDDTEVYVHRSGRTGRAGNKGISITIASSRDYKRFEYLSRKTKSKFIKKDIPSGKEVCEQQLFSLINKIKETEVNNEQIKSYLPSIFEKLDGLTREELINKFVSIEFNKFLNYYKDSKDLNIKERTNNKKDRFKRSNFNSSNINYTRFYINIGKKDNLNKGNLMGFLNDYINPKPDIGKIEILDKFSFFEMDKSYSDKVNSIFKNVKRGGRKIIVEKTMRNKRVR